MSLNPSTIGLTIKAATRRLVAECGGQESAALVPGIRITRHQSFSEYGQPAFVDRVIAADVVAVLEADCGTPFVTRELAAATGHVLVKLPATSLSIAAIGKVTGKAMKETSEVFGTLGASLEDDVLDPSEREKVAREIDEAIVQLLALKLQVSAAGGTA